MTIYVEPHPSFQDVKHFVFAAMYMERRGIAIRHPMFDNADAVLPRDRRNVDRDKRIVEPEEFRAFDSADSHCHDACSLHRRCRCGVVNGDLAKHHRQRKSNDRMERIDAMNLNALDLNLIRVLDALLRERSVTRAGEQIGLSQPAVSAALNRLRHALNDQLFVRRGNEMLPTPRAESLAEPVRRALSEIERVFHATKSFEPAELERTFTLMGADFFSMLLMPSLAARIASVAPGVSLRFLDSARGDVSRLLQDDEIDAALERPLEIPDWVSSALLFHSPFAVIAARDNAAIGRVGIDDGGALPMELFCELPHAIRSIDGSMSGFTDEALSRIGRARRVSLALPHFQAIALAVASGNYLAAVPRQFAEVAAKTLPIIIYEPPLSIPVPEIRMYWHARHDDEPPHRWIRQQILEAVDALGFADLPADVESTGD
ncbi:LysR family transcriptional regulator [Ensifer aridi]|uniref:LysR family transcriptional regulator n=1 Tax=Ensifer aridi TaxID=1708715 RepID=UPI001FCDF5E3|nr:LysR family transcriptional regulator [Ensifer aridi]